MGAYVYLPPEVSYGTLPFSPKTSQQLIFIWCTIRRYREAHNDDNGQFQINNNQQHSRFELTKNYFNQVQIFVCCNFRVLISMRSPWFIWSKVGLLFRCGICLCDWESTEISFEEKELMGREEEIRFVTYRSDALNWEERIGGRAGTFRVSEDVHSDARGNLLWKKVGEVLRKAQVS